MKLIQTKSLMLSALGLSLVVACSTEPGKEVHGIHTENMDKTVKPSQDFFRYVNGAWLDKTEIPSDRTSWGSFNELRKKTDDDVLKIMNEAIANNENPVMKDAQGKEQAVTDQQKAIYFYESIMDTVSRNEQGIAPVMPYLKKIDAMNSKADMQKLMIEMAPLGGLGYFDFGVYNDLKDSKINAGYLGSSGLGLSQDYYLDQDEDTAEKREKYKAYIANMLDAFGIEGGQDKAQMIFEYEYDLAAPRMTKEERRDARKSYNPMTIAELRELAPEFDWTAYFEGIGVGDIDRVIVSDPKYMKVMNDLVANSSMEQIKAYATWNVVRTSAGMLTTELETANWEFYSKELRGAQAQRPREERALSTINWSLGEAVGQLYVAEKFPPEAKEKAEEMIANVMLGFEERIQGLSWMSDETKQRALDKLHKMTVKIAYPDEWKDYSKLMVDSPKDGGSYFSNSINLNKWNYNQDIEKLGKPVDRKEWGMAPQIVNAYFNPVNNEIVFPAAILQPPFYDPMADEAVNYGGIGAVIGHEISHSFDDSGSRFDGDGNLKNWWTDQDREKFDVLGKALSEQFDNVVAIEDVHLNGEFTLGENIGDLGGLNAALAGLEIYYRNNGRPGNIDGFTPEQRFFMSWATVWRTKMRDDALKNLIKTDPHSPGMYRAYMPLQNMDAFYEVFEIKQGNDMYLEPEMRVRIW
ncbi:M13 family metallopeptidase [Flavobacteriaceae bacterium]|nr:M13 family metallopeptidase [Flavobacteriaceae bacterium]